MTTAPVELPDVVNYVLERADENDLDSIAQAINQRRQALQEKPPGAATIDATVTIGATGSPRSQKVRNSRLWHGNREVSLCVSSLTCQGERGSEGGQVWLCRIAGLINASGLSPEQFARWAGIDEARLMNALAGKRRFSSLDLALIADSVKSLAVAATSPWSG